MQADDSKLSIKSNPPPTTQILELEEKLFSPQEFYPSEGVQGSSSCSGCVVSKAIPGAFFGAWWLGQWQGSLWLVCEVVWLFLCLSAPSPLTACNCGPC